jgi:hypothetical protein
MLGKKSKAPIFLTVAIILIIVIAYVAYQRSPASVGLKVIDGATNGKAYDLPDSLTGTVKKGKYVIFVSNGHVIDSSSVRSGKWDLYADTDGNSDYGFLYVTNKHYDTLDKFQAKNSLASEKIVFTRRAIQAEKSSETSMENDEDDSSASSDSNSNESSSASSKAASKSMALDSFKKSLQARVQNDSVHLSSYQLNGGSEVTYTATAETAAFDRATLQAYADHLFDNTQQLAAMCDISIPVVIVLQAPNGNFLARTKLDGTAKVYPQ